MKNRLAIPIRNESAPQTASRENGSYADPKLLELVRLRVGQIHQCLASMEDHEEKLVVQGETRERLRRLETWEISGLFDGREKAALALCEKISLEPGRPLPDHLIHEMRRYFAKEAIINLTLAIMAVNDWIFSVANTAS